MKQRSWETDQGEKRTLVELAVTEVGPSLKFATATVAKATRPGSGTPAAASDTSAQTAAANRPDEPPF